MHKSSPIKTFEGNTIKSFVLEKFIGQGACSQVYLGYNVNDSEKRKIAIKKFDRALLSERGIGKDIVENEIKVMKQFAGYANMSQYIDDAKTKGDYYIMTNYYNGGPLNNITKKRIKLND